VPRIVVQSTRDQAGAKVPADVTQAGFFHPCVKKSTQVEPRNRCAALADRVCRARRESSATRATSHEGSSV
jgi:hypothetical protein